MNLALFDLDDTLFDRATSFRSTVELFARELNIEPQEFVTYVVDVDADGTSGWFHWMQAAQERFNFPGEIDELIKRERERYLSIIPRQMSSIKGLRALREMGWKIVIITNGSKSQLETAGQCGVLDLVDECIMSGVVGVRKPDPEIFKLAARAVGEQLDSKTTWMIGDNATNDIGGALGVNIRSLWMARGRRWPRSDYSPDFEAATIDEAFAVLYRGGKQEGES